ncbi:hypothetical protein ACLM5J_03345 [Nocardioides sp. Bht2]|uniref:hypothetical protein n=1 Tax=Nocardioides sp. Bht2 TaxID=3392297 RepID=UPI0039B5C8A9
MKDDEFADLLGRATRDIPADVERLVADAGAQGRRALRRRRVGAAFAAAGVTAAVTFGATLPDWGGGDTPTPVAQQSPGFASAPSGAASPGQYQQPTEPDRPITIDPEAVPQLVGEAAGATEIGPLLDQHPYSLVAEENELILHFRLDGTLTTVMITPADESTFCRALARGSKAEKRMGKAPGKLGQPAMTCRAVDGIEVASVTSGPVGSEVKVGTAMAWNHGYRIDVVSYNVAAGKNADGSEDVPALRERPLVDGDTLVDLVTSEAWFD